MEATDHDLIESLIADSEFSFQIIYSKYAFKVYQSSFFLLKDTGWSEDVVQDVFVKLWRNRKKLDANKELWSFLYVLTKRTALNKLRDIKSFSSDFEQLWESMSSLNDCPFQKVIVKELAEHIDDVLRELPERQREIFRLSKLEGFTYQQIADKLKISPNTVKNHMIEALKIMKRQNLNVDYLLLLIWLGC